MEYVTYIIAVDVPKEIYDNAITWDEVKRVELTEAAIETQIQERHGFKIIGTLDR